MAKQIKYSEPVDYFPKSIRDSFAKKTADKKPATTASKPTKGKK